ncbi:hypothetical protein JAAARDRAFT_63194 [Jaapia argillacea MUCL 33604]|uniref:BTB domain-containing protein n=1 Tax=Jaapia argillacea MUCL 33604 TaxID=933084 RepID=A0A067PHG0_9AGAM|nr:hypothetical protein JAAARDRAFT_63194 [Jaapia argillacea MUCL 33604]
MSLIATPPSMTDASHHHNSLKADIILHSSDNVDFPFFKLLLSLSSPFFNGMFDLPSDRPEMSGLDNRGGLVVVAVDETSRVLTTLLSFIHPSNPSPSFDSLETSRLVLQAADKYGMDDVIHKVEAALMSSDFMEHEPGAIYAIACSFNLEKAARAAAKLTLCHPIPFPYSPELEYASAASIHRLLVYRQACIKKGLEVCPELALRDSGVSCSICPSAMNELQGFSVKLWLWNFVQAVCERIQEAPCGDVMQYVASARPFIKLAINCQACRNTAMEIFCRLAQGLKKEIDEEISAIHLEVKV